MQHPEEGLIHAWLDGALPAEESGRIEAHVASCGECASAVAEARGLIAASSRIVGHLDAVPGNVIPISSPKRSRFISRAPWLAGLAAALLISLKLYMDKPEAELVRADSAGFQPAPLVATTSLDTPLTAQVAETVQRPAARVAQADRRAAVENTTLPPANAAVQKSIATTTQPSAAPISAPAPVQQRADVSSDRAVSPQPSRAMTRAATGSVASGSGIAAATPASTPDRTLDSSAVLADTTFVGCYELVGVATFANNSFTRFALTAEAAPTPGLLAVHQLDAANRPYRIIFGAGWRMVSGQAVVTDADGKRVVTLRKTDSAIVGVTPSGDRTARVISCR